MNKFMEITGEIILAGAIVLAWTYGLLYFTLAGKCVNRETQTGQELSSINMCLNPVNWER